jgi:outer membrane protein TolC
VRPQTETRSPLSPPWTTVRAVVLLGAFLALPGVPARSQESPPVPITPLTLAEALDLAERQNPDLAAARAQGTAAAERAEAVRRGTLPRVGVEAGWSYTDIPSAVFAHKLDSGEFTAGDFAIDRLNDPAAVAHLGTTLAVEAPIDAFGKVRTAALATSAQARSAEARTGEGRLDLRLQVATVYRRAALAKRAVAVTESALAGARSRESDLEARVEGGAALTSDLLRARARRREREADLAERLADQRSAAAALTRVLGAQAGTVYEPVDEASPPLPLDEPLAAWTERALATRPTLAATAAAAEAARRTLAGEDKARLPDLAAWGRVQDNRTGWSGGKAAGGLGVALRWSAFDPARDRRKAAAAAELDAAELQERAAADQVRLEVEVAWHRARAARERFAAAAGGAEEGREALRVIRERRLAGLATLTDELETEAASLTAELQELRAAAEAALADAALERAAGGRR